MAEAARQTEPDDGLTPGERAYMNGGDVAGLVKEGLQIEQPEPSPDPKPEPKPEPAAAAPAPSPADTPVIEPPAPPEGDDEPEIDTNTGRPKTKGRWVSKKALDEARAELKQLRQEHGTTKEQWARLEERFKVFQEAVAPAEPAAEPEPALPDPEQDIFGYLKALAPRIDKRFSEIDQRLGQVNQTTQARDEQADLVNNYAADARRFSNEQQDFGDAYRFLIQSRDAELAAAGYSDAAERARLIKADEQNLVRRAMENGASPAAAVYAVSKARGYAVKAAAPAPAAASAPAAAATPAPAAQPAPAAPTAAEEIARVKAGQDAALSLSNVGGNRPNNLSVMDLVNMPMDEFAKFARQNPNLLEQMAGK